MHPNMYSRPQLPITGCFGCTEVDVFSVSKDRKGVNATKQKILCFLEVSFLVILLARIKVRKRLQMCSRFEILLSKQTGKHLQAMF